MKIEINAFSGIAPRYSPELLNEQNGQIAENLSIKSGKIHPEKVFNIKSPDRDYVPGQVNDDQYHRLYFLDSEGNLSVCGTFPDGNGNISEDLSVRHVDISAPGKPEIISISSPFLDAIGDLSNGVMVANYGSTSWKSASMIATHIYSVYAMTPIDKSWIAKDDGSLERSYQYNPWLTTIYYPKERA
jgi:hypothetical protein